MNRWLIGAGVCMGLAWFTRSAATPIVLACVLVIVVLQRNSLRRAATACTCLLLPIIALVIVECGLNFAYAGQFRPSNGTAGATILLRARNFEGFDWPDTPEAQRVIDLLPQRNPKDAYVANLLDSWVARYHAVHDRGVDEWQYDGLMRTAGLQMLRDNWTSYVGSSAHMAIQHLLRRTDGQALSPIANDRLAPPLIHPAAIDDPEATTYWFAYWGLPHLPLDDSIALVDGMKSAARQRAPFGDGAALKALRYWKTKPIVADTLNSLTWLSELWPGFALIGFVLLGLHKRTCVFLATAYVVDALFIGFLTPTTARIQFTWIVTDTVLVAGLVVGLAAAIGAMCNKLVNAVRRSEVQGDPSSETSSLPAGS